MCVSFVCVVAKNELNGFTMVALGHRIRRFKTLLTLLFVDSREKDGLETSREACAANVGLEDRHEGGKTGVV